MVMNFLPSDHIAWWGGFWIIRMVLFGVVSFWGVVALGYMWVVWLDMDFPSSWSVWLLWSVIWGGLELTIGCCVVTYARRKFG